MVYLSSEQMHTLMRANSSPSAETAVFCLSLDGITLFVREFGSELAEKVVEHVESVCREIPNLSLLIHTEDDVLVGLLESTDVDARQTLERVRQRIGGSKLRFTVDGQQVAHSVTVSVGIAPVPPAPVDGLKALRNAGSAWAEARRQSDVVVTYQDRDVLTELLTGQTLFSRLNEAILAAGPDRPVSLLQIDIDRLAEIESASGANAAADILKRVGASLEKTFGQQGTVGRLWSDEFMVILPETRTEDAAYVAEGFRRDVAAAEDALSLSLGVASFPRHASDPQELMRKTREARYTGREAGGGRTSVAESDQMTTKTSHFSKIQLKRLAALARKQGRSEAALLREGLDSLLQVYEDGASEAEVFRQTLSIQPSGIHSNKR